MIIADWLVASLLLAVGFVAGIAFLAWRLESDDLLRERFIRKCAEYAAWKRRA